MKADGAPSRTLKFATDCRAFTITGRCPEMVERVDRIVSRKSGLSFWFSRCRPTPTFTTILESVGTWCGFLRPNSCMSFGEICSRSIVWSRGC